MTIGHHPRDQHDDWCECERCEGARLILDQRPEDVLFDDDPEA